MYCKSFMRPGLLTQSLYRLRNSGMLSASWCPAWILPHPARVSRAYMQYMCTTESADRTVLHRKLTEIPVKAGDLLNQGIFVFQTSTKTSTATYSLPRVSSLSRHGWTQILDACLERATVIHLPTWTADIFCDLKLQCMSSSSLTNL